jgi:diacylglycerol O-acyltransferase
MVFNLTVSNIPGPSEPMYMLGCELQEAYPVVPIAEGHAMSIGVTTICDRACFGVYADAETLPEADELVSAIHDSVDELLTLAS